MVVVDVEIFRARRVIALADPSTSTPSTGAGRVAEPAAFAVLGGQVVATGSLDDLTTRFPGATLTDFGDSVIVPGFNDAHIHPSIVAEDLLNLDVSSSVVGSLAELTRKVLDQAVVTPPGTWIRASRYDDAKMPE